MNRLAARTSVTKGTTMNTTTNTQANTGLTAAMPNSDMRAIVQDRYGSADTWELCHIERPHFEPDEVLLQVHAAGSVRIPSSRLLKEAQDGGPLGVVVGESLVGLDGSVVRG
jgi:hypothetical protein